MNILIPDSWLREFLDTKATVGQIKECLSLCGPSVEEVSKVGDDFVYNIEITSNRIDMVSVYGIAREAAAILPRFGIKASLKAPTKLHQFDIKANKLPLSIEDPAHLCHRLMGVVLDNVRLGPSPAYMRERLEKAGVRSLNNAIDITNYVMLELGHPCHVFDYDRIKTGKLLLRRAKTRESLVTLDNKKYNLKNEDVIIDDGTGRIIDLPGIMGTLNSIVTGSTKRVVLFIESNNPVFIRKTSLRLAIRTLAATINEKHPDPGLVQDSILSALELFKKHTGASQSSDMIDIYPYPPKTKQIRLESSFINNRLGVALKTDEIVKVFNSLQFRVNQKDTQLTVTPPSFRQFDVTIKEDLVEEVARIYGYHNIPTNLMNGPIPVTGRQKPLEVEQKVKLMLKYWGYTEVYNYSFVSKKLLQSAGLDPKNHLRLTNPLSVDMQYLRQTLMPSLFANITANQYRTARLNFFELASVYIPQIDNLPLEKSQLALVSSDDFFRLKGLLTAFFDECGISVTENLVPDGSLKFVHPKQSVDFTFKDEVLAYCGFINPLFQHRFGLKDNVSLAVVDFEKLVKYYQKQSRYVPISPYSPVFEDFTLQVSSSCSYARVVNKIKAASELVKKIELKDRYKGKITLQIMYHKPDINLTLPEVANAREKILKTLDKEKLAVLAAVK